jgi:hypothetical protein
VIEESESQVSYPNLTADAYAMVIPLSGGCGRAQAMIIDSGDGDSEDDDDHQHGSLDTIRRGMYYQYIL